MKKILSVMLLVLLVFSCTMASAGNFYPADSNSYYMMGDWNVAADSSDVEVTTVENATASFLENEEGLEISNSASSTLPNVTFAAKPDADGTANDTYYHEASVNLSGLSPKNGEVYRLYINGLSGTVKKEVAAIKIAKDWIEFRCANATGSQKSPVGAQAVEFSAYQKANDIRLGISVNLSTKIIIGYIDGKEVTRGVAESVRDGYIPYGAGASLTYSSNFEQPAGSKMIIKNYKAYKLTGKYVLSSEWDFTEEGGASNISIAQAAESGAEYQTYYIADGVKISTITDGVLPTVTCLAKGCPGAQSADSYYHEILINTSSLPEGDVYKFSISGYYGSTQKQVAGAIIGKNTVKFLRGNDYANEALTIASDKDIKLGFLINQSTTAGSLKFYVDREIKISGANGSRANYISAGLPATFTAYSTTTYPAGTALIVKDYNIWRLPVGAVNEDEEGALAVNDISYNCESVSAAVNAGSPVKASVTINKGDGSGWSEECILIVTSYDAKDSMYDVSMTSLTTIKGGETKTLEASVDIKEGGSVKAMLWNGFFELKPLAVLSGLE